MGEIYGLYSTNEGRIRYVGQTEYTARKRLDLTITKALEHKTGALFDWVRDQWADGAEIQPYTLQDEIIPADLDLYECYWIEQFGQLLNVKTPADSERMSSDVGERVNQSVIARLRGSPGRGN